MRSARLAWLLALLVALAILRILVPPSSGPAVDVAQAVPRQSRAGAPPAARSAADSAVRPGVAGIEAEPDRPGNAFAARTLRPPVVVPAAPAVKVTVVAIAPPPPPPEAAPLAVTVSTAPPVPSFQVIGTWDDGGAPGVFIAGSHGTLLARQGSALMAEYNLVRITAREVSLLHLATGRELQLPIPQVLPTAPRP